MTELDEIAVVLLPLTFCSPINMQHVFSLFFLGEFDAAAHYLLTVTDDEFVCFLLSSRDRFRMCCGYLGKSYNFSYLRVKTELASS